MTKYFAILCLSAACQAATFGTVVPVRGVVSDIALDEGRGRLYIANLSANRIEVMNTSGLSLANPLALSGSPSAVALSADSRYLVAGYYNSPPPNQGGFSIFDLSAGTRQDVSISNPVLAVAFAASNQALVITAATSVKTGEFLLLDPVSARTQLLGVNDLTGLPLPVPFATFAPNITEASTGVSGDGKTIMVVAEAPAATAILSYHIGDPAVAVLKYTFSPPSGPRAISVNSDASRFILGWSMFDSQLLMRAQFPYPLGDFRKGGIAFDWKRNLIYGDVPVSGAEAPMLHVADADNLTIREQYNLPQMMSGRSLFSSDMNQLYAVSDSGIMVLPVGSLFTNASPHRVVALQEDVVFQDDACTPAVTSKTIDIADLGGGVAGFTLSLPANAVGVRLSQTSGVTPATIRIDIDPTVFRNAQGTTTIALSIKSPDSINIALPVRLLINTHDVNQRGRIVNVPGKITDMLADPVRNRIYLVRQDKNLVLVYDTSTFTQLTSFRTGNTPMGMAITEDQRYLIVGNDNSQYASVFDLETLQPAAPIPFTNAYPHQFAVGHGAIWATARTVGTPQLACVPALGSSPLYSVNFSGRLVTPPCSLGIYINSVPPNAALTASPSLNSILLAIPDGTVLLWDGTAARPDWVLSRKDLAGLGGAYAALDDNHFLVGNNLLDQSLFPAAILQSATGTSSGAGMTGSTGLRTTTMSASAAGTIERVDLSALQSYHGTPTIEAPKDMATLQTPTIGQIGETILPFTRTLAVPADQKSILFLTESGLTVVPPDFDAPSTPPVITSVVNSADGSKSLAQGGLALISGTGLAPVTMASSGLPLPLTLGGVCLIASNMTLPLFLVSPTQITAQLPFTVTGDLPMAVHAPGGVSNSYIARVDAFAPAIFHSGAAGSETGLATVVRDKNNQLVTFTNPIHPDETISIYLTGLGQTTPPAVLGAAAQDSPLQMAATTPQVTLGDVPLAVTFAGLMPGYAGVYQINAVVPRAIANNPQSSLVIGQGQTSTTLLVRVVNP